MQDIKNGAADKKRIDRVVTFVIVAGIILLVNIIAVSVFLKLDLTDNGIYSLSKPSKRLVKDLGRRMTVKLFFSEELPPPFSTYERYMKDFLREYQANSAGNLIFESVDVKENPQDAKEYGIYPIPIMVLEDDRLTQIEAYFGAVFIYGDTVKQFRPIEAGNPRGAQGKVNQAMQNLEYDITSTIKEMADKYAKLNTLENKINVRLFISPSVIDKESISSLDEEVSSKVEELEEKLLGKIEYEFVDMGNDANIEIAERMNVPKISDDGYVGIAVSKGEEFRAVNILRRDFFSGRYYVPELKYLGQVVENIVDDLLGLNPTVGYLTGNGQPEGFRSQNPYGRQPQNQDSRESMSTFVEQVKNQGYKFMDIDPKKEEIPTEVDALFIVNPTMQFDDYQLYQIDQFIMSGKPTAFIVRGMTYETGQRNMMGQAAQKGEELNTGIEKLLEHYGVELNNDLLLDKNCYKANGTALTFAPMILPDKIDEDHPITRNIKGMIVLEASTIEPKSDIAADYTSLVRSSDDSWTEGRGVELNPYFLQPREDQEYKSYDISGVLTGKLTSYFSSGTIPEPNIAQDEASKSEEGMEINIQGQSGGNVIRSTKDAKIFIFTSPWAYQDYLLSGQDDPNTVFVRNTIDWLVGDHDLLQIRSKGLKHNPPKESGEVTKNVIRVVNIAGLPMLVILLGLLLWRIDIVRRKRIAQKFNKNKE